jgi:hypothetical protein
MVDNALKWFLWDQEDAIKSLYTRMWYKKEKWYD